jgi:hypothetical protein
MPYNLVIKEEAHKDAAEAYYYYETKVPGLGERFLNALKQRYFDLSVHPQHYSYINEDPLKILRDVRLPKFPYVVVFEIAGEDVIVYAVYNAWKDPEKKIRK